MPPTSPPTRPLPLADEWAEVDAYVDELLSFATSSVLFRNLCGGVHILDFLTREPDLYSTLVPHDWAAFFESRDIHAILDLLLRDDLACGSGSGRSPPPASLVSYIAEIRRLSLGRDVADSSGGSGGSSSSSSSLPRHIAVGMNVKKRHEVENFARYVDGLCSREQVSHVVDFGSGQNYLGRTLASSYDRRIIAIERRHAIIAGAGRMDAKARLVDDAKRERRRRETDRPGYGGNGSGSGSNNGSGSGSNNGSGSGSNNGSGSGNGNDCDDDRSASPVPASPTVLPNDENSPVDVFSGLALDLGPDDLSLPLAQNNGHKAAKKETELRAGSVSYIEHDIQDGYLEPIIRDVVEPASDSSNARVMVVSLHSCGNLVHHGIRSLVLNPSVVAVAMIGCCYNLMTERLGPATYKLPVLRSLHPRLTQTATAYDPHGFPMSQRLAQYAHDGGSGIKLNITARMMAVQAPGNWGEADSEAFFTRHFYRALLQRVLLDKQIIRRPVARDAAAAPPPPDGTADGTADVDVAADTDTGGTALIVGSLRKAAFRSFPAYVRAATAKLATHPVYGRRIAAQLATTTDTELDEYVQRFWPSKKQLSITWSLMAVSAAVVEALIVVDRWQFLREHDAVRDCWVEPVFSYRQSPRNLAVVGVKW